MVLTSHTIEGVREAEPDAMTQSSRSDILWQAANTDAHLTHTHRSSVRGRISVARALHPNGCNPSMEKPADRSALAVASKRAKRPRSRSQACARDAFSNDRASSEVAAPKILGHEKAQDDGFAANRATAT